MKPNRLIITFYFFLFTGSLYVKSMPAYPKRIPVTVGDGTIYIQLYGDEHNKRAETTDGYSIIQKEGEWYYAEHGTDGKLKASSHKLTAHITNDTKQYLESLPKHLTNTEVHRPSNQNKSVHQTLRSQNAVGIRRILVILMQYTDLQMNKNQQDFNGLFNGTGYSEDGARGSVCDYYTDVSYGQLQLTCDIIGPFTSLHDRAYYGGNDHDGDDSRPEELFEEAIQKAAEKISLKDYDSDDDGYVDNVHIIFAGHGEEAGASSDAIWSHEATFYLPYEIQGMKIDRYSCAPELRGNAGKGISRIGPHCHEIGHALGAMDYYDTDYELYGNYIGTGNWDVMASGSWNNDGITPADFNPYVKAFDFGWISPKDLPSGDVTLHPSCCSSDDYYILRSPYSADYYILENRNKEKWGAGIPGEGLLVFHIHPDISTSENSINSKSPQKCYVVCAASKMQRPESSPSSYGDINSDGCPYPGSSHNTDFGQNSIPAAFFWDDEECWIELNNISRNNEGNIRLENNSTGVDNDGMERKRIFFEGFEGEDISINIFTDEEDFISTSPSWIVESNPQGPSKFIARPSAYKGSKSLQLSAKRVAEKATSLFSFSIPEDVDANDGSSMFRLRLYVNSTNPQTDNPNIIQVRYRMKDDEEWQHAEFMSSEDNHWQLFTFDMPGCIFQDIYIEGTAFSQSVLAIDNLEIEMFTDNSETGINEAKQKTNNHTIIHTLSGIRQEGLQRGINIVRMSDGRVVKVLY